MAEKKKYKKKNDFTIKYIFNEEGEQLDEVVERTFEYYCLKKVKSND